MGKQVTIAKADLIKSGVSLESVDEVIYTDPEGNQETIPLVIATFEDGSVQEFQQSCHPDYVWCAYNTWGSIRNRLEPLLSFYKIPHEIA